MRLFAKANVELARIRTLTLTKINRDCLAAAGAPCTVYLNTMHFPIGANRARYRPL